MPPTWPRSVTKYGIGEKSERTEPEKGMQAAQHLPAEHSETLMFLLQIFRLKT
jgi:hypothetical protein